MIPPAIGKRSLASRIAARQPPTTGAAAPARAKLEKTSPKAPPRRSSTVAPAAMP